MGNPQFQIEKGIPLPPRPANGGNRHSGSPLYPWRQLQVGDSFFVPATGWYAQYMVLNAVGSARRRFEMTLETRRVADPPGVRVWRTA